jgi:putative oxidoreductase
MSFLQSFAPFVGRILIAVLFLWSGFGKLAHPAHAASRIASVHVPYATAAAVAAGLLEIVAGAALVLGLRTRGVALALLLYVVAVTWLFHWPTQMVEVMKNAAIAGGLLGIVAHGPGRLSMNP